MIQHVCVIEYGPAIDSILDYVAQFHAEKLAGEHTRDFPCENCQENYQPASSAFITRERRDAIKRRDKYKCIWCQCDIAALPAMQQTLDHLVTLEEYAHLPEEIKIWFGSKHKTANLVSSCKSCNSKRKSEDFCTYAQRTGATQRIQHVLTDRRPLNIQASKARVGNNRRTYKNAWSTQQRLSQGISLQIN